MPLVLVGALFAYVASPYYGLYALSSALESGDRVGLENSVDFVSLRQSLKEEASGVIASASSEQTSDSPLAAGLLALFAPKLIDAFVDAYVTPAGISQLLREGTPKFDASDPEKPQPGIRSGLKLEDVRYAFFSSPTSFRVETDKGLTLYFEISDWRWKLSRISLPPFDDVDGTEPAAEQASVSRGRGLAVR